MTLSIHGDAKYQPSSRRGDASDWASLHVEHRRIDTGTCNPVRPDCTELVVILSGQALLRQGVDGPLQGGLALPGTSWLVPAGTDETVLELDGSTECLMVCLPARLLADSTLIYPGKAGLVYEVGFADPTLIQIGLALRAQWRPAQTQPAIEPRRLQRVLDYVDANLAEPISLADLAGAACLSPFHFSRQFRKATGLSPHRYVMQCRIAAAKRIIAEGHASLVEVALDTGFGSQANFSRTFRKMTGLSPREYRTLHFAGGLSPRR